MNVPSIPSKSLDDAKQATAANIVRVSKAEYDWLSAKLEEPPRKLAQLSDLFSKPSVFES